ncbi:MAG TPA: hypothetical protein VEU76_04320 [Candidatus Udaeobacter sp.]|nr:hypothetical protein [Candidatus Udaeobacter sp.]
MAVRPRHSTQLGISFRPRQAEAFGLELRTTLDELLAYPFELVRLAAYWDRIESSSGEFDTRELEWQVDAAERAGKKVILAIGPIKNFGYPEFYVPRHHLERPLREGSVVRPEAHAELLSAAKRFIAHIVAGYQRRAAVVAWQLEHEAVDPLGFEHSWRLGREFVEAELATLRASDAPRPVMMNGFLASTPLVNWSQRWRTRDQGDSLAIAEQLADIVGVDHYPRHALLQVGGRTLYADGTGGPPAAFFQAVRTNRRRWMVAEGQSEPWETTTRPPIPNRSAMFSCGPNHLIENYNAAMSWSDDLPPWAYLFWGVEYWISKARSGDRSYLGAFQRLLEEA